MADAASMMARTTGSISFMGVNPLLFMSLFPQDALRPDEKQDDKDDIVSGQRQADIEVGDDAADDAEDEAPDKAAGDAAHAAQDHDDDGDNGIFEAHGGVDGVGDTDEGAGDAGHGRAESETYRQHQVDIHAHQPGGGRVLGRRPDGLADTGTGQEEVEAGADN